MEVQRMSHETADARYVTEQAPTFGVREAGRAYRGRRAAYAVVFGGSDAVAAVRGASGRFWLPGGGSSRGESAEDTLLREVREELARGVRLIHRLGEATQYFHAKDDDTHYRMEAVFFWVELTDELQRPAEHDLVWLPFDQLGAAFFHECHGWAVSQAVALRQGLGGGQIETVTTPKEKGGS